MTEPNSDIAGARGEQLPRVPGIRPATRWRWPLVAAAAFALAAATLFHALAGQSWRESVLVNAARAVTQEPGVYPMGRLGETDHRFVIWLTTRNAYTLLRHPGQLFQAEPCHPAEDVLALGEPGISMGLLAIPGYLLTRDPIATHNCVLVLISAIAFAAMYLLVKEWTGVPAAGVVAALLYAFHEIKTKDSVHIYVWDNSWTVLALLFASRLFARRRWADALGLGFAISMQLAGSLYPLIAAVFVAIPVMIWLIARHGVRDLRPAQWAVVVGLMLAVAVVVFSPSLQMSDAGVLGARGYQVFLDLGWFRAGGPAFPGWLQLLLVAASFAIPRRFVVAEKGADPRWALLVVGVLLVGISSGGNTAARLSAMHQGEPLPPSLPNLYDALGAIIPGMKQVRGPAALYSGVHLALCVLAGFGAAAVLRAAGPRRAPWLAAALILFAYVDNLRPGFLGLEPRIDFVAHPMRPPQEEIDFFERIAEVGANGPMLELPFNPRNIRQSSRAVLLSAYHRRRTAQCFNSYLPPEVERVKQISDRLPDLDAVSELAGLGFSTIVIHEGGASPAKRPVPRREEFERPPATEVLKRVGRGRTMTAYDIVVACDPDPHPPSPE